MTLQELSVLHDLKQEIEMDMQRLRELDLQDGTKAQKAKVRKAIRDKKDKAWAERERLELWIAEIPDSLTRQVFTWRFVQDYTWMQVAMAVGGGNTEDSVRMLAKRYVRRHG